MPLTGNCGGITEPLGRMFAGPRQPAEPLRRQACSTTEDIPGIVIIW